jgi:hypothetical protein
MSGRNVGATGICAALALALAACGGGQSQAEAPGGGEDTAPVQKGRSSLSVSSEIGALDEAETQEVFKRAASKLSRCFEKGLRRVPYMGGEVRVAVRVSMDGSTRWAYVKDSSLGDLETEQCMLQAIKGATWPKPVGGEGLAENSYTFDPSPDERQPVSWAPEQLGKGFEEVQPKLASCRSGASTGALKATLYVDPDGKVVTAGVSGSDEKADGAVRCVVEALRGVKFPSPGSYDAKVSVTIE